MKQFLFAKSIATDATKLNALSDGAIGFAAKGLDEIGGELKNEFNLVVKEGDYLNVQPIHSNKFKWVKSTYKAPTVYKATIELPDGQQEKGLYSLIIVKNGVKFNERNKWTVSVYVKNTSYSDKIAEDLIAQINKLGFVKATYSARTLAIEGVDKGVQYTVVPADMLIDLKVKQNTVKEDNVTPAFSTGMNDAKAIKDLYDKCVADRGMNYTYNDNGDLYPNLPFNHLKGSDNADKGFTVYTLTFAEPRNTKTTDEVVNQVVHVVFPSDVTVTSFDEKLQAIVGGNVETTAVESPAVE